MLRLTVTGKICKLRSALDDNEEITEIPKSGDLYMVDQDLNARKVAKWHGTERSLLEPKAKIVNRSLSKLVSDGMIEDEEPKKCIEMVRAIFVKSQFF